MLLTGSWRRLMLITVALLSSCGDDDEPSIRDNIGIRNELPSAPEPEGEQVWEEEYYDSGQLKKETPFVGGILHGTQKEYHPSGVLRMEQDYRSGKPLGRARHFNPEGQPIMAPEPPAPKNTAPAVKPRPKAKPKPKPKPEPKPEPKLEPKLEPPVISPPVEPPLVTPQPLPVPEPIPPKPEPAPTPEPVPVLEPEPVVPDLPPDGPFIEKYPDGKIRAKGVYKNGMLVGLYEKYAPSGHLIKKLRYDEDGSFKVIYDATK